MYTKGGQKEELGIEPLAERRGGRQITPPRVVENSTQAFGKSHLGLGVNPGFWKIPPRVL